jgi:ADP-ribose pyrophosphatase
MKPFYILHKELCCDNPWIPVEKQRVRLPNGSESDWYVTVGKNVVITIPILDKGGILLQRAYKHGCGEIVHEFCAGIIENGEEPEAAAKRELLEETGYTAKQWKQLGQFYSNPTGSQSVYHVFLATGCQKVADPQLDEAEQIENFSVPDVSSIQEVLFHPENKTSSATLSALFIFPFRPKEILTFFFVFSLS